MPSTYLNYPFDAEIFFQTWNETPDTLKTALLDSGVMVNDALIASRIQSDSNIYTIPFYDILDGDPVNYDGATDITSTETSAGSQSGVVYGRAKGFTARNFVSELSGSDPMQHIANSVGRYWNKYRQKKIIDILSAIFGITGASGHAKTWAETHHVDVSSDTASARTIKETDFNDLATLAMGDNKSEFSMLVMHSTVANTLENMQLLDYWKQTDANGLQRQINLASVNGYMVLIDDSVPTAKTGGTSENKDLMKYTTYLLGSGAIRNASGRLDIPAETERDPSKNGGQDTLYTRIRESIHPNGFSFKIPSSGWTESPTDEQLKNSSNWTIKFDPKSIPIASIITNG